jgi:hypothetical protein
MCLLLSCVCMHARMYPRSNATPQIKKGAAHSFMHPRQPIEQPFIYFSRYAWMGTTRPIVFFFWLLLACRLVSLETSHSSRDSFFFCLFFFATYQVCKGSIQLQLRHVSVPIYRRKRESKGFTCPCVTNQTLSESPSLSGSRPPLPGKSGLIASWPWRPE